MDAFNSPETLLFGPFRFDRRSKLLFRCAEDGRYEPIGLGSRALTVLGVLTERPGDLVTKDEIMCAVWPGTVVEESNLTVQISTLRRVLDVEPKGGSCIQTVSGRGYRFVHSVGLPGASAPVPDSIAPAAPARPPPPLLPRARRWLRGGLAGLAVILTLAGMALRGGWLGAGRPLPYSSIFVLPFQHLGNVPGGQDLAEAVTGDITTDLARIWDLHVIMREEASGEGLPAESARRIGRELGVRYVLVGSVEKSNDRVETNFRLLDAESGEQLSAARFRPEATNVLELQTEIGGRIARTLYYAVAHAERRRIEQEKSDNPSARDLVMLGWDRLNHPDTNSRDVRRLFERALELDPKSVNAQLGLAKLLLPEVVHPATDASLRAEARADQLLNAALTDGSDAAQAHATRGFLRIYQNRLVEARIELKMAVALDPSNSWAHYGLGEALMYLGMPAEGIEYIEKAMRLNPSHPNIGGYYWALGACHLLLGHVDQAIDLLREAYAVNPRPYSVHEWLAGALGMRGELDEARTELVEMQRIRPDLTSLQTIRRHFPWSTNPDHLALRRQTIDLGLRLAGLPDN